MENKLYSPKVIQELLTRFHFSFSKGLGQNFLIDGNIVRGICDASKITKEDNVLEVGPGFGVLTQELCQRAKKVVAVEIDKRLPEVLEYTLKGYDNFSLVQGDILKLDLQKIIEEYFHGQSVKVIANLPYYVTTPIVAYFLENKFPISSMTIMVQKEVADRMVAEVGTKDYGALSLMIKYYTDAEIALSVPKTVFMPSPKVDSAVVHMEVKKEYVAEEALMFDLIRSGFMKRRKNILNSLTKGRVELSKEKLKEILEKLKIDSNLRAENLSLKNYKDIARFILEENC